MRFGVHVIVVEVNDSCPGSFLPVGARRSADPEQRAPAGPGFRGRKVNATTTKATPTAPRTRAGPPRTAREKEKPTTARALEISEIHAFADRR
jgi:hypothetical protein